MKKTISFFILLSFILLLACTTDKAKAKKETNNKQVVKTEEKTIDSEKIIEEKAPEKEKVVEIEAQVSVPPEQLKKAKAIIASVDAEAIATVNAKKKYKMVCALCHGFKGNMNVNGAKDLTKSKISLEESVAQIYFGKGLMTSSKGILSDVEMVAVAKYIEELRK